MAVPALKHVFDLVARGPAEFPYIATQYSNICVAHGKSALCSRNF